MATGPKYNVKFRRGREDKTDYKKRLAFLKSKVPRLIIRGSNKNILCQVVEYHAEGDKVLASGFSKELEKLGWSGARANTSAAYLVGYLCGKKAKKAGVKKAILDIGFTSAVKGSKVFASLKGAVDAGLEIPHDASKIPSQDRIDGAHIGEGMKGKVAELKKKIDSNS